MAEHDSGGGPGWETPAGGAPSGNTPPDGTPAPTPLRTGPPWEREGGFFDRFFETVKGVLTSPTFFFDRMRREGGLGPPLGYAVIGSAAACSAPCGTSSC